MFKIIGSNTCDHLLAHWPVQYETVPYTQGFYMIQAGSHLYSLIMLFVIHWKAKNFFELLFHHFNAMYLVQFSYYVTGPSIGLVVQAQHDFTDIPFFGSRILKELGMLNSKTLTLAFSVIIPIYGWGRIYAMSTCVVKVLVEQILRYEQADSYPEFYKIGRWIAYYLLVLISLQVFISCYWFSLISKTAIEKVLNKKVDVEHNIVKDSSAVKESNSLTN